MPTATDTRSVKQLTDALLEKQNEWKQVLSKGHDMTAEDLIKCERFSGEVKELKGQVDRFNNVSAMRAEMEATDDYLHKPERRAPHPNSKSGFGDVGSYQSGETTLDYRTDGTVEIADEVGEGLVGAKQWKAIRRPEYKRAFSNFIRKMGDRTAMPAAEMKELQEGLDDQGGYLSPIDVTNRIIQRKPTPTRIAAMCANMNTSREYLEMMKVNYATDNIYTTGFRVTKTGEIPTSATQAQVTDTNLFGVIRIPNHTFMIRGLLTNNMVEDAVFDPIQWMSDKFSETIEILRDDKVINGTGRMEPYGLVQAAAATAGGQGTDDPKISVVYSGDPNTVTADGLINLALDVPEQYEDACKFYFNKVSTFRAIRVLKDLNDRYLFGMGTADSGLATPTRPTDLIGYPYVYSGLFPNTAAGNYPIFFGDLQGYQIVNRIGFSVQILRELYAETNAIAIVGRYRFGGLVIEPWRLRAQMIHS